MRPELFVEMIAVGVTPVVTVGRHRGRPYRKVYSEKYSESKPPPHRVNPHRTE